MLTLWNKVRDINGREEAFLNELQLMVVHKSSVQFWGPKR